MVYLALYLAAGVVIFFFGFFPHLRDKRREALAAATLHNIDPEGRTLRYRIMNGFVLPIRTGTVLVALWPLAIGAMIMEFVSERAKSTSREQAEAEEEVPFAVTRDDLLEELSAAEVEAREMVHDPLGAVPNLPFGHLNNAWKAFLQDVAPDDAIWKFSARRSAGWGGTELVIGYVVVRGDSIGSHIVTEKRSPHR